MPDYYAILGVPRTAAPDDIKRAYRKLARESHPDANPDDSQAEERFKQIKEAYEVLADPAKRRRFDTMGDAAFAGGSPFGGGGFGDLGDIMDAFFGGRGGPFGGQRARRRTSAVAGQDIGAEVSVDLREAVFGTTRDLDLRTVAGCERCDGDGCEPGTFRGRCETCGGQGEIRATRNTILGTVVTARACTTCGGAGEAPSVPCTTCGGVGRVRATRSVTIEIPPGVSDGATLRLRDQGEAGVRGGPTGDLYVQVTVQPHELYERHGDDLLCNLEVQLTQAVLGADIEVDTLDGAATVTVPSGTEHGTIIKLRGHGATRVGNGARGDLLVHVSIVVPSKLGPEERAMFEQIAVLRGDDVSGEQRSVFGRLRDTLRGQ